MLGALINKLGDNKAILALLLGSLVLLIRPEAFSYLFSALFFWILLRYQHFGSFSLKIMSKTSRSLSDLRFRKALFGS